MYVAEVSARIIISGQSAGSLAEELSLVSALSGMLFIYIRNNIGPRTDA
jgi:hypothetical protein